MSWTVLSSQILNCIPWISSLILLWFCVYCRNGWYEVVLGIQMLKWRMYCQLVLKLNKNCHPIFFGCHLSMKIFDTLLGYISLLTKFFPLCRKIDIFQVAATRIQSRFTSFSKIDARTAGNRFSHSWRVTSKRDLQRWIEQFCQSPKRSGDKNAPAGVCSNSHRENEETSDDGHTNGEMWSHLG